MVTYDVEDAPEKEDEQKRIIITKEVSVETNITIAELKREVAQYDVEITSLKSRRDELIDKINEIKDNTDLTIDDVPTKT